MKRTELAHWRYRVKALDRDLEDASKSLRDAQSVAAYLDSDGETQELLNEALLWQIGVIELTSWLLEEARYKSELG